MKKVNYIYFVFIILFSGSVFGQEINSDTTKAQVIASTYFSDLDHSSYIELILYANGNFLYKFKFEAAGVFKTKGKWRRTKNKIVFYDIKHTAERPPAIFQKRWYLSSDKICSKKNRTQEDVICLKPKPCD